MLDEVPTQPQARAKSAGGFGARVGLVALLLVAVVVAAYVINEMSLPRPSSEQILRATGLGRPVVNRLDARFADANGDLVADAPINASAQADPEVLSICYVPEQATAPQAPKWKHFADYLAQRTGKPVEYLELASTEEQLAALKSGRLHVAGLNTGNVPMAVNAAGFVPVCSPGTGEGEIAYKMQLIVPASSPITRPTDLKGHTIALTHPQSNSGYKAPLVILRSDFGLEPERDFLFVHSQSHTNSIKGVASGEYEAAAVASDMLQAAIDTGIIKSGDVRVIYESEPFPKASVGYLYSLKPELARAIADALLSYSWQGTGLEAQFASEGATQFVAVSYKNDWALIRRIDDAIGLKHEIK